MQTDCDVYVDPEEDEVFFGCMSDREKTVSAKLVKNEGPKLKDDLRLIVLDDCNVLKEDKADFASKLIHEQSSPPVLVKSFQNCTASGKFIHGTEAVSPIEFKNSPDQPSPNLPRDPATKCTLHSAESQDKFSESLLKDENSSKINSNASVELEHNYSTPLKHKIDKSILTTPKSIVKADKDGGFLKVLSEIALVKAEAEGDKKTDRAKEDEDKENISSVPEIKITEATPEKSSILSPPKCLNSELRRFRVIHNSPQNEDNIDRNSKSQVETFESERNLKNKCLNEDGEKFIVKDKRKSIDLIDLKDFTEQGGMKKSCFPESEEIRAQSQSGTMLNDEKDKVSGVTISGEKNFVCGFTAMPESLVCEQREPEKKSPEVDLQRSGAVSEDEGPPKGLRFSKDARKVVEVLKKSSGDDTLNFTVPEINVEEEENTFLSPEPASLLDETVLAREKVLIQSPKRSSPKLLTERTDNKVETKAKTIEKDRVKLTPAVSQGRPRPIKYFSERRILNENGRANKNGCAKRLPFEKTVDAVDKVRGGPGETKAAPSSRIPVYSAKSSKVAFAAGNARPLAPKVTPSKSPFIRTYKNSKFNHIESPINAYIHNKPTSLVLNIKPEVKKDALTKVWKAQTEGSVKKFEEKAAKVQSSVNCAGVGLPFVEYKSTTPYKIEKRPESRLPRLAPTVMKLIGPHSPRVIKHEGRFYLNSPRSRCPTENGTIVADPKEVSVVVSRPAQKSNTIK